MCHQPSGRTFSLLNPVSPNHRTVKPQEHRCWCPFPAKTLCQTFLLASTTTVVSTVASPSTRTLWQAEWLVSIVGLVEASPSTLKLWQSVRLASSAEPRVSCSLRRFWQAGTLWQPVCLSSNPPPSFAAAPAFSVLCGTRAGGRPPPGPARPAFSLCFLPPGAVAGGRAGVYLTRGAGGATGGGEYGRGRGIWGIPRPADRSLYSSIFSVCGISISSLLGC